MAHVQATLDDIGDFQLDNQSTKRDGVFAPASTVLLGAAGSGKTQWCLNSFPQIVAEARGLAIDEVGVVLTQPSIRDAQEYVGVGIPQRENDELVTRWSVPNLVSEIKALLEHSKCVPKKKCVVLVIDEISACGDDTQKVLAPLVGKFEKRLGDHTFGEELVVIMTGNRAGKDKAGARKLLGHFANRCAIFEVLIDHGSFAKYAEANDFHPLVPAISRTVDGFYADAPSAGDGQVCTYRQIEQVSDYLKQREAAGRFVDTITPAMEIAIAAFIGIDSAAMLTSFARQLAENIPTAREIFDNPLGANVPDNPASQQFAVNRATADIADYGPEAANQLFDYINRLAPDLQVIAGVKAARQAVRAGLLLNSDLANSFMVKHHDLIELASIGG